MSTAYTKIAFTDARDGGITAVKLNHLRDDLSAAIASGGGGTGTGDMTKAVYDTNANNVVDTCDSLAWGKLTGVPATFPPDSTAMLKSVYDTNANNKVDGAETADSVPWTGITGKPASFVPSAHATTHLDNGSDPVPVVTSSRTGLAPVLSGNAATYLNGGGTFNQVAYVNVTGTPTVPAPSSTTPAMDGTAAIGVGTTYARNDHVHPSDTSRLALTGGTMTGPLVIDPVAGLGPVCLTLVGNPVDGWAQQYFNKASGTTGVGCAIVTTVGGSPGYRWALSIGDSTVESGSNTGSDFKLEAYSDAGASLGVALKILRANGTATFGGPVMLAADPSSALGAATKQYVDSKTTGTVNPGVWTNLSLGSGWTAPTQAQYRIEVNGAISTVHFRGMIQAAYSAMGTPAFTAPAGAQPSMTRSCVLGGAQNTGTASDVASYVVSVSSAGVATIYFLAASAFVWADPAQTQQVYLDGLFYSL